MEWDELSETGRMWRVRVQLLDRPGSLAALTDRLSTHGCNLLGVSVLPIGRDPGAAAPRVIDEFVLRAPTDVTADELAALIEVDGLRCLGISPASAGDLVDAETAVLRAASAAVSGRVSMSEALRRVLGADSVTPSRRAANLGRPGAPHLESAGHRAYFGLPTMETLVAERVWAPFTEGELARATALLDLLDARPSAPIPELPTAPPPAVEYRSARQLTALDAVFLNVETPTSLLHVGNLLVLDPSSLPGRRLAGADLRALFATRMHLIAPLRWRLREVPLGLDLPYWEDTNYVDLNYHVREIAVAAPGTDVQLSALVAKLAAQPLDRRFPLWEVYLISGLSDGRQALYAKIHHSVVDGVSGAEVLSMILDLTAEPMSVPAPPVQTVHRTPPPALSMLAKGVFRSLIRPVDAFKIAPALVRGVSGLIGAAPRTPFNGPVSAGRTYAFTSLPLSDVKEVKNALGGTVNDVVMAMCTTALRRWLLAHRALPDGPLAAVVPVSIRTPEEMGKAGNQISFMQVGMPTNEPDPLRRFGQLRYQVMQAKAQYAQTPQDLFQSAATVAPQVFNGVVTRMAARVAIRATVPTNLVISNVPGPQIPLYAAGARVTGCFPVSLVSDVSGGINVTVMSYAGSLDFGIIACPSMVPDVGSFSRYLWEALEELTDLCRTDAPTSNREMRP